MLYLQHSNSKWKSIKENKNFIDNFEGVQVKGVRLDPGGKKQEMRS